MSFGTHSKYFNSSNKETYVLNFQVGKGKTSLCYDLIEEYYLNNYIVIVCSPFKKLIEKDYEEITNRISPPPIATNGIRGRIKAVFNYADVIDRDDFAGYKSDIAALQYSVHIMTINCLLGNSGDDKFEQNFHKKNYLENLLDISKGKKVVLFLDEVHESIDNFTPTLIPNILKWKDRIDKVFIASATFTPATIPVIKTLALLTDNNINVLQSKRTKNQIQSDIHLHIVNFAKNDYKNYCDLICTEIAKYQTKGEPTNIITGTRAMAEKIAERQFSVINKSVNSVKKLYKNSTINLLTSKTNIAYQKRQNNIGTTFKTGVNLDNISDVLFVAFPLLSTYKNYGTFSNGVMAIIQSIGRLRNGGKLHIFINEPNFLIGQQQDYPQIFNSTTIHPHQKINTTYDEVKAEHTKIIRNIFEEILLMETHLLKSTKNNITNAKNDFGIWFPSFSEFLLNNSQSIIHRLDNVSFGRLLSPYILWACIYDQFINAKLKDIKYHTLSIYKHKITTNNSGKFFTDIMKKHILQKGNVSFRDTVNRMDEFLGNNIDENGTTTAIEYENKKNKIITISAMVSDIVANGENAFGAMYVGCNGIEFPFNGKSKMEYVNACIDEAENYIGNEVSNLHNAYKEFGLIRKEFEDRCQEYLITNENKTLLSVTTKDEIMDNEFIEKVIEVIDQLKENDKILKSKAFQILQNTKTDIKTSTFNFLQSLSFPKVTSRQIKGANNTMYNEVILRKSTLIEGELNLL